MAALCGGFKCLPAPRRLLSKRLEARKLLELHQRRLDRVLDLGLVLVEEGVRDARQLLVGVGGDQEEPLACISVLAGQSLAELMEVVIAALHVVAQLGAVDTLLLAEPEQDDGVAVLHVNVGHQPFAQCAAKGTPHVLEAF